MSRIGKIARLPLDIRSQLNHRLFDGESGRPLLQWLNALPQVRDILQRHFDSRDISDQNLSEWRTGGYREWLLHQESVSALDNLAANAAELAAAAPGRISDHLATTIAARYAAEFLHWDGADSDGLRSKLRFLREISQDIVRFRRGDLQAARLHIEQARLDQEREKTEEEILRYFRHWLEDPKVRESILSSGDPEKLLHNALGVDPPPPATLPPPEPETQGNSN